MKEKSSFLGIAMQGSILRRSLVVSVIVGTVLNMINQGDVVTGDATFDLVKCLLTYAVPFFVSIYGSVAAIQNLAK